jgi:hypothetical protein
MSQESPFCCDGYLEYSEGSKLILFVGAESNINKNDFYACRQTIANLALTR